MGIDPVWIPAAVNDSPDDSRFIRKSVVDRIGENPTQHATIIHFKQAMYPAANLESLNIAMEAG